MCNGRNLDALEEDLEDEEEIYAEPEEVPTNTIGSIYATCKGKRLIVLGIVGTLMDHSDFTAMEEIPTHVTLTLTLTLTLIGGNPNSYYHIDPRSPIRWPKHSSSHLRSRKSRNEPLAWTTASLARRRERSC